MDGLRELGSYALYGLAFVLAAGVFMALGKWLFDTLTPYSVRTQLVERGNPALGVVLVGYLLGMIAVLCGSVGANQRTTGLSLGGLGADLWGMSWHAAIGLALLLVAGLIIDRLCLAGVVATQAVIDRRNVSVGVVLGCGLAGMGLVIGGALHGCGCWKAAIFACCLGLVAVVAYTRVYRLLLRYNNRVDLAERENLALGIGLGGHVLAYCLLLMRGAYRATMLKPHPLEALAAFAYYAGLGALLLLGLRLVNDRLFMPRTSLRLEMVERRNTSAGIVEAALAIAVGSILVFALRVPPSWIAP